MATKDRLAVFPSRSNEVYMKQRIFLANKGLGLLKRKRDAIDMKLREITVELETAKQDLEETMREAYLALSKAKFLGADLRPAKVMPPDCCDAFLRLTSYKVAGINLPTFTLIMRSPTCFAFTGLSAGGGQVELIREHFQRAIKALVAVASLTHSFNHLSEGLRINNMRLNGLDYVVIPRLNNTLNYIREELDELEREEFFRLKQSAKKQKKKRDRFNELLLEKCCDWCPVSCGVRGGKIALLPPINTCCGMCMEPCIGSDDVEPEDVEGEEGEEEEEDEGEGGEDNVYHGEGPDGGAGAGAGGGESAEGEVAAGGAAEEAPAPAPAPAQDQAPAAAEEVGAGEAEAAPPAQESVPEPELEPAPEPEPEPQPDAADDAADEQAPPEE